MGEDLAARFLKRSKKLRIIAKNWRNPSDRREELDLVCEDQELLVFVEVKTRKAGSAVRGAFAVDRRKQAALRRAILAYLRGLSAAAKPRGLRFDIVEVSVPEDGTAPEIAHFENVPLFGRAHF